MALGRNGAFRGGSQPAGRLEYWVTTSGGANSDPPTRGRYTSSRSRLLRFRSLPGHAPEVVVGVAGPIGAVLVASVRLADGDLSDVSRLGPSQTAL